MGLRPSELNDCFSNVHRQQGVDSVSSLCSGTVIDGQQAVFAMRRPLSDWFRMQTSQSILDSRNDCFLTPPTFAAQKRTTHVSLQQQLPLFS